jgi:uroporphyrinogen-III synthase
VTGAGPLAGRRVVVTRAGHQATTLREALARLGAEVVEAPAIEIAPPDDATALDTAVGNLAAYDWVVFTSPNAVAAVRRALDRGAAAAWPPGPRIASVGGATSQAVAEAFPGRMPDLEAAGESSAQGLLRAFAVVPGPGRILLPVSDRARPDLAAGLRARGAAVEAVVAYRNRMASGLAEGLSRALERGIDLLVFASPSAAEAVAQALGPRALGLPAVVIGKTTHEAARDAGFAVLALAREPGPEGLARAAVVALSPGEASLHPSP